jgi:hypothetical protein
MKQKDKDILAANPVLAEPDCNARVARWEHYEKQGIKQGLKPYSPELAKFIAAKMKGPL